MILRLVTNKVKHESRYTILKQLHLNNNNNNNNNTKTFNAIIEEPEKTPNWLTTGITYLIPKSGDSKEVRNYRPITCLTTMYKTLTGIIAKRISIHLEEQRLLPVINNS